MNHAIWISKKNHVCTLIKKISDHYGGDDLLWLQEYAREVIDVHKNNIEKALDCFLVLEKDLKFMKPIRSAFHVEQLHKEVEPYESRFGRILRMAEKREEVQN